LPSSLIDRENNEIPQIDSRNDGVVYNRTAPQGFNLKNINQNSRGDFENIFLENEGIFSGHGEIESNKVFTPTSANVGNASETQAKRKQDHSLNLGEAFSPIMSENFEISKQRRQTKPMCNTFTRDQAIKLAQAL